MTRKIYALLVGINQYQGGVPSLWGCVNDVLHLQEFLKLRTQGDEFKLESLVLTSGNSENPDEQKPTREAVIAGFRQHLSQAGEDDVALFYFSGHGSQERAPQEFWHLEPDRLNETLVLYDSRTKGSWDLADKELAVLISEVARKNPHLLVVLDACHSGSGTRGAEGTGIRLANVDMRQRPLEAFLPEVIPAVKSWSADPQTSQEADQKTGQWFQLPQGRHIVLAACRPEQSAREKRMPDNFSHGVLSYFLLEALKQAGPNLSYRDIFSQVSSRVSSVVKDQDPIPAATDLDDLLQPFLGGAINPQQRYAFLEHQELRGWVLKAGAIHGIEGPVGDETTHLSVFPLADSLEVGTPLKQALAQIRVVEVGSSESRVEIETEARVELDPGQIYKAVITGTPLPRLPVHLAGDDQPALEAIALRLQDSALVRPTQDASVAALRVTANTNSDSYQLGRAGDRQPLRVDVSGKGTDYSALVAAARVEHIAQWLQVLNLQNQHSQILAEAVVMEVYRRDPLTGESQLLDPAGGIRNSYSPEKSERGVQIQIRLHHTGQYPGKLYCMLVNLTDDFAVESGASLFGGGVWLDPGQEVWVTNRNGEKFIYNYIPKKLRDAGITQIRDVMKLIVSTDESEALLLKQNGLEVVVNTETRGVEISKKVVPSSSLHRLMRRVQTRSFGDEPEEEETLSDWRTSQVELTTTLQRAGVEIPAEAGRIAQLASGVSIEAHPGLRARAKLEPFSEGKRDLGNLSLPAIFRDHPELVQPFDFQPARGGDAGSSVIVLDQVTNPETVTPRSPLIIRAETGLGEHELILPVAFDPESELFLPLGVGYREGEQVKIQIERLPAPVAETRDIAGSIRLFIQKVVAEKIGAEKLGLEGGTARLALASLDEGGRVVYDASPITLKKKVSEARRILLYIHGIIGDTRGMVASAYGLKDGEGSLPKLIDGYDLILAFDYENINTPIEETASALKKALLEAGLGPDHGKTVHIVAHSMGCMVTRWFIERDNGGRIVQKALLVAPPNGGTPWAKIEEFILFALGAALNGLAALAWPPSVIPTLIGSLATLLGGVEKIDVTLDQLKPDSPFYRVLNSSDDPGLKYTIIAGNTSKIPGRTPEIEEAEKGLLKKLIERLTSAETRNRVLSLAFLNAPNDIALSVKSMSSLPAGRNPEPDFIEIACDHISYFNTEIGMKPIVEGLQE